VNEPAVMATYARYPLTLVRGAGTRVWDDTGRGFLDFAGALGVTALGHSHPAWVAAVRDQLETLDMVSNLYATEPQAELAARLAASMPVPDARVFFCNSGAEANEAAIKLARKQGLAADTPAIVALEGSFHGRTNAALAATGQPAKREPFEPLVDWFRFVPPGDLAALDAAMTPDVGAVLLEPVMGEGGVRPLDDAYLRGVRELCDERGALLVADEVQSGLGRCGDWAALQHAGVEADVLTLAKALGGGLPIGALVTGPRLADVFQPGDHGSTFAGGPLVAAAANAAFDVLEDPALLASVRALGERLREALRELPGTTNVRGRGLMIAFDLVDGDAPALVRRALAEERIVLNATGPRTIRLLPPLIVTAEEVDDALSRISRLLAAVVA
jgi:acetylornithine/N-succinyldiaminopimelate aminotransferase